MIRMPANSMMSVTLRYKEKPIARSVNTSEMDESSILGFAFETAALSVPAKYSVLPDNTVEEIAANLERGESQISRENAAF